MTMVIKPKNWKEFQHYKDRNPPWIKLHKSLLDNYEFHSLQLASKALAPCYWLLASEHPEGFITVDEKKLAWRFRVDEKMIRETVKELISSGFFELVQDASKALADRYQDAMPETETETETETEKDMPAGAGDAFELFWSFALAQYRKCDGNTGNKKEAQKEFAKLKPNDELLAIMRKSLQAQADARVDPSGFVPHLKHVCRWIKNECWNDVEEKHEEDTATPDWMRSAL